MPPRSPTTGSDQAYNVTSPRSAPTRPASRYSSISSPSPRSRQGPSRGQRSLAGRDARVVHDLASTAAQLRLAATRDERDAARRPAPGAEGARCALTNDPAPRRRVCVPSLSHALARRRHHPARRSLRGPFSAGRWPRRRPRPSWSWSAPRSARSTATGEPHSSPCRCSSPRSSSRSSSTRGSSPRPPPRWRSCSPPSRVGASSRSPTRAGPSPSTSPPRRPRWPPRSWRSSSASAVSRCRWGPGATTSR